MPAPRPDPQEQLRCLNALIARFSDLERGEEAFRALEFFYREHPDEVARVDLGTYVERLRHVYFGEAGEPQHLAFAHWHVPQMEAFSPLWIRQAIVARMKRMAGHRQALLLVTGLREAICPEGKYWTTNRSAQFQRVREWIDALACAWASRGAKLQVVVL